MSFRQWLNVGTVLLIVIILVFSRHELYAAWQLLSQVNLWIFLLVIPLQFLSYYAAGATIFSYLRAKGDLQNVRSIEMARMALELNFVNHVLPTGGVSGASYMTWRLGKLGVSSGRATLAQVVRFGMTFAAFLLLLLVAVLLITLDGNINRLTILVSSTLASAIIFGSVVVIYVIGSQKRLHAFSRFLGKVINGIAQRITRKKKTFVSQSLITKFFEDLHEDYLALKGDPRILLKPLGWGVAFNVFEVGMFMVTFLALGTLVNPAPVLIAVGIASFLSIFLVTPGGAGGYEALMILFLSSAGVSAGVAVAGVLLARVTLILLTIVSGYLFYHQALKKYGRAPDNSI
jgi:uncharacterized protein (TIRG00374 family)